MRKLCRILPMLLIMIMVLNFSCFSVYADSNADFDKGQKLGIQNGKDEGYDLGIKDLASGNNSYKYVLRTNLDEWEVSLRKLGRSNEYVNGFISGYSDAFTDAYFKVFTQTGDGTIDPDIIIYGAKEFGELMGRINGYTAYKAGKKNDWTAYIPSDRELRNMFELDRESRDFEDGFIFFFKEGYKESFDAAFQVARLGQKKSSYEDGLKDGDSFAKSVATLNARRDYYLNLSSDYKRDLPSDRELVDLFNLKNESKEYEEAFIAGFEFGASTKGGDYTGGYMNYYNKAFRKANKDAIETPDLNGESGGQEIGTMKGEFTAKMDFMSGKSNDWTKHKENDKMLIENYGLAFQSENYKTAFIVGYWDSFMKEYNSTYKELQQDKNKIKTFTDIIPIDGGSGISVPGDDKFMVDIGAGTYFDEVMVTIDSIPKTMVDPSSSRHTVASGVYGLKIMNAAGTFENKKKITIKFKSFGKDNRYGIYKYHFNKWVYIPSRQEGGYIVADININNINLIGNVYAVRIDNELPTFHEIRGHWAKEHINTYVKREIIYGYPDMTFLPDRQISRREFVAMLARLYEWYPPFDSSSVSKFKDYKEFGYAEKAISYATNYGIVNGYPDGTFRPHDTISYKEVEIIMSKILVDSNFKWDKFATKMIYDYNIRSKSKDNMNNKITRAEFTFLLHQLNEWQY